MSGRDPSLQRSDAAQTFFERLGFSRDTGRPDDYRMMSDAHGSAVHLNRAAENWLQPGRNPFGLYLYREDVATLAAAFAGETVDEHGDRPWGMYEFALNGPDDTLIRIGRPTRLRAMTQV